MNKWESQTVSLGIIASVLNEWLGITFRLTPDAELKTHLSDVIVLSQIATGIFNGSDVENGYQNEDKSALKEFLEECGVFNIPNIPLGNVLDDAVAGDVY